MTNELTMIAGALGSLLAVWGGMRAERWKAKRDDLAAEKDKDADAWHRVKETIGEMRTEIRELKTQLDASDKANENAAAECDKRVAAVRIEFTADLDQAHSKLKVLSRICLQQQLDLDTCGIKISRLEREKVQGEPIPGGRRSTDDAAVTERQPP